MNNGALAILEALHGSISSDTSGLPARHKLDVWQLSIARLKMGDYRLHAIADPMIWAAVGRARSRNRRVGTPETPVPATASLKRAKDADIWLRATVLMVPACMARATG